LIDCTPDEAVVAGEFLAGGLHLSPHFIERH
jgi:hypothetical protein